MNNVATHFSKHRQAYLCGTIGVFSIAVILGGAYWAKKKYDGKVVELTKSQELLAYTITTYDEKLRALESTIADGEKKYNLLVETLQAEQAKNGFFAEQIRTITEGIGVIEKLAKTDPELLQKYSKVYFLNENYTPEGLAPIAEEFTANKEKDMTVHAKVAPFLTSMLQSAKSSGTEIKVTSAYRSFGEQTELKSTYKVTYGSGANKFSADQGYSEHQLGTTLDFTSPENNYTLSAAFENTKAFTWLQENAHKYGFVLSYPKGNAYYVYEPWHWRFVGVELATRLHTENKHFYDLDQREIDRYIVNIFD